MGGCSNGCGSGIDSTAIYFSNDLEEPTSEPTIEPTFNPSTDPTSTPTNFPSDTPSNKPSLTPTSDPSLMPSTIPTSSPSSDPSVEPTTVPSRIPSEMPSATPTLATDAPTKAPSSNSGSGSTGTDNGDDDNGSFLSITTEAAIVVVVGLILGCLVCFVLFVVSQKHNQKQQMKILIQAQSLSHDKKVRDEFGISGMSTNAYDKHGTLVNTNGTGAPGSTGELAAAGGNSANKDGFESLRDVNTTDFAAALELVKVDMGIANNNNINLPAQPNVNVNLQVGGGGGGIQHTNGMNFGEGNDDNDNQVMNDNGGLAAEGPGAAQLNNINIGGQDGLQGLQGTGAIAKRDWTKWDENEVMKWLSTELKNFGFTHDTINDFLQQFGKLHMTGVLLNVWLTQVNGNVNMLTMKFQNKLQFAKESMVWDVVIQAMISLKN